jgi:pimeloyl-ACP methyl ester carboxylesterase
MLHDPAQIDDFAVRLQKDNLARQRLTPAKVTDHHCLCHSLAELPAVVELAGINGENDFIIGGKLNEQAEAYRGFRSGGSFRVVPGGSHWVMYDSAEEFNRALLDSLAE